MRGPIQTIFLNLQEEGVVRAKRGTTPTEHNQMINSQVVVILLSIWGKINMEGIINHFLIFMYYFN